MTEQRIRVLVADDHPLYRDGIVAAVEAIGAHVVGVAADGDEAVHLALELAPDVVLMDVSMPGTNGLEATTRIRAEHPGVAVLVLTMLEDEDTVVAALRAGAQGYLVKGADRAEIASALDAVRQGQAVFGSGVAGDVLARIIEPPRSRGRSAAFPNLTDRELEILELLALGLSNRAIARRLVLSDKTVRNHVSNLLAKLPAADREEAGELARAAQHHGTS
jgi:DNA-binding NarL/FixJ family response regulator